MKINPKNGIDKLLFGMKQPDVVDLYGAPDKKFKDDDKNVIYVYDAPKLRLTFYEDEDFRLGYLIAAHSDLELNGNRVIGLPVEEVKKHLTAKDFAKWEAEDFDLAENHFNEANWIILQSEFGSIAKVELGAIINEKDDFEWKFTSKKK